ncbi:MAG: DNA repair protein RadA [Promicromonosporaceae bacterium]|nr:DNA repair protein RadA [Promicromonosporaceae bacterium]
MPSRPAPARPAYACVECGWTAVKWVGRCGECQAWGTVAEAGAATAGPRTTAVTPPRGAAQPIAEVSLENARAVPTGVPELDRVLGGGLVPGAVILLAGEPGVGKSTLLLEAAATFARGASGAAGEAATESAGDAAGRGATTGLLGNEATGAARSVLYVTGEESAGQVRLRAERVDALAPTLLLAAETDLATVLGHVEAANPDLLIVDSVQTVASVEVEGVAGGVSQVREVAGALIAVAKRRGMPVLLVGHVTKDGSVAGPRTLEHLVDVVCQFEGDRHSRLRLLRASKNRYGATDEVGCFELTEAGIVGLSDPSGLFVTHLGAGVPGSCVTITAEGKRPLAVEIQALVTGTSQKNPRRTAYGVETGRLSQIVAVLQRHVRLPLQAEDVYVSTVGGARAAEPATDLAVALAIASGYTDSAVQPGTIAFGEVGLTGDIRAVVGIDRRLLEAARLGFSLALVPPGTAESKAAATARRQGLQTVEVRHLSEAIAASRQAAR